MHVLRTCFFSPQTLWNAAFTRAISVQMLLTLPFITSIWGSRRNRSYWWFYFTLSSNSSLFLWLLRVPSMQKRASNCWWMKKKADLIKLDTWTSSRWLLSLSSKEKLHLSFWVGTLVIIIIIFLLKMDRFGVECGYHFLDLLWRLGACWCLIELRFIVNSWLCNKIKHLSHRHKSLKYRIRGSFLDSYWIKVSKAFRTEMTTP